MFYISEQYQNTAWDYDTSLAEIIENSSSPTVGLWVNGWLDDSLRLCKHCNRWSIDLSKLPPRLFVLVRPQELGWRVLVSDNTCPHCNVSELNSLAGKPSTGLVERVAV